MARRPSNRLVREAIREILEPELKTLGFAGKYPEFRRDWQDETHFVAIFTRKYGSGFSCTGAWRKRLEYIQSPTYRLAPEEVRLVHTEFDDRATLVRIKQMGVVETRRMAWRSVGDFDYTHIVEDEQACRHLVLEAVRLLPSLDHWLKTREPGLGIDTRSHRMRSAQSALTSWHFAMAMVGQFDLTSRPPATPHRDAQREASLAPEYPA